MTPDDALVTLGRRLRDAGYRFVTVTPDTHQRLLDRDPRALARDARDIFGWNRWFETATLDPELVKLLELAGALEVQDGLARSRIRLATYQGLIIMHSSFPTAATDAVFFGPDTYRFSRIVSWALERPARLAVEVCCGTGAAGLVLSSTCDEVILSDINPQALRLAAINARINGITNCRCVPSDLLADIPVEAELIIANPPYIVDGAERTYCHGGGCLGTELSVRIVTEAVQRLRPGGRLGLYTGVPVIGGVDQFLYAIQPLLRRHRLDYRYEEIDPDVFGGDLEHPAYHETERLAAIALTVLMTA